MLSLILPYWDRQEAADKALELLARHYGRSIEVIVVDDGNRVPFKVPAVDLHIRVVRLPTKDKPTPQSKAWNAGVRASTGNVIALSCVEVLHEKPILEELAKEAVGSNYVLAAAWCPELREWQCHTKHTPELCPPGTGPCFLGVMQKSLFLKAGGFDEKYHDGAGYEDKDFIHRMLAAGAKFIIRDDLAVVHPKSGATIAWPAEGFRRNDALFRKQWIDSVQVHFVCLNAGNYLGRGAEYVNKLADMVKRNMPPLSSWKFSCVTDDPAGLDAGINVIPLPGDLKGWWGKLYLFKRGLFPDGARMIFLDLDTLIVGRLDEIIGYRGQFATLRDFYHPSRVGPAVMLWEAGDYTSAIWEEWDAQGRPLNPLGDLGVINNLDQGRFASRADKLQSLYPNAFVSYKVSCNPYPPQGTKVVCFHGLPRPHEVEGWVADVWKIGGTCMADLVVVSNTQSLIVEEYVRQNTKRPLAKLQILPEHGGHAVIVGGGPSLKTSLDELRWRQEQGQIVIALNGTAHFLRRNGVLADWQVILDARPENAAFVLPDVPKHFFCSQCHPSVYERGAKDITIFHINTPATVNATADEREVNLISTGSTVGLISMGIAYTQGFRNIHLFGMDSSYADGNHHAYAQALNDSDRVVEAVVGDRVFNCAPWMVAQVNQFQEVAVQLADLGCTITVAGEGLLPHVAHLMAQPQMEAA